MNALRNFHTGRKHNQSGVRTPCCIEFFAERFKTLHMNRATHVNAMFIEVFAVRSLCMEVIGERYEHFQELSHGKNLLVYGGHC